MIVTSGQRFGRLVTISLVISARKKWLCICDCGTRTKPIYEYSLKSGNTKSCGCIQREFAQNKGRLAARHNMYGTGTYNSWIAMKGRCFNPNNKDYKYYGGRGIKVYEPWMKFENFLADMGIRPDNTSLDRIDTNGDYEPGNCRWSTIDIQNQNRRIYVFPRT